MTPLIRMKRLNLRCTFTTPDNVATYELVLKELELHVASAYSTIPQPSKLQKTEDKATTATDHYVRK